MNKDRKAPAYPVRLTIKLKEKLKSSAKANCRSLNAEMTIRLNDSFKSADKEKELKALIEKILDKRDKTKNIS